MLYSVSPSCPAMERSKGTRLSINPWMNSRPHVHAKIGSRQVKREQNVGHHAPLSSSLQLLHVEGTCRGRRRQVRGTKDSPRTLPSKMLQS